jgi:steroid delta-isomerase-like uncharacterized protein
MAEQANIQIDREVWDAWNAHDPDRYVKLLDEKWVAESDALPGPVRGHDGAREFMKVYVTAFPDLHFSVDQTLASGEFVVSRYTATGTHRGALMGIPATNRSATVHGCTVGQVRNGKVMQNWIYWDTGNLLRQLGVLPTPK